MVVTLYMGGQEISEADLRKVAITQSDHVNAIIGRVIARVNASAPELSTQNLPDQKR
ncbi:hypothetical protein U6B65_13475 [Oscillospiraceae bacterium MB08-C2-2]|nr:hypothetical protein U6B65_13475 [Oscillospiraceae bacterium MB08-C2-2]